MKKLSFVLVLALILTFTFGATAFAGSDLTNVVDSIQGAGSVIGNNGAKEKILGISKDAMDIVMIGVTAIVVISGLITGGQFTGAGDDPQKKAKLKTKIVYHVLGLVFLANYFGLFDFIFGSVQIF